MPDKEEECFDPKKNRFFFVPTHLAMSLPKANVDAGWKLLSNSASVQGNMITSDYVPRLRTNEQTQQN